MQPDDDKTRTHVPLTSGTMVSHYRIIEKIGAGGMGEVYLAEDTNLSRQVAIKVLPDLFSGDPERLARFEREAKLLASLNHPNLATVYGFESDEGKRFLVMEMAEGETLAERVAKGPLPLDDALDVYRQIAAGMEAAHEKGIIHRDLKPANIKITPEGKVKILDFGLAKALHGETAASDVANSPTITENMTRAGVILGTAAYMSPEQAKGRPVDKRTDIWAFGCIVYECLTGKRAFEGETVSETLAAILRGEPDWDRLPKETPTQIKYLLKHCLQKNPAKRLHDIGDAMIEVDGFAAATLPLRPSPWHSLLPWSVAVVALALAVWSLLRPHGTSPAPVQRFAVSMSLGQGDVAFALSPDGRRLVYVGRSGGAQQLFVRQLDQDEARPLAGTENGVHPFFSPDGQWIGYLASGELRKLFLDGGKPIPLCQAVDGFDWGKDDTILFCPSWTEGLWKISAYGGPPIQITRPDHEAGEVGHFHPHILPGGAAVLFTVWRTSLNDASVDVLMRNTGERRTLLTGGTDAHYVPTGHLVYAQPGALCAAPFSLRDLHMGEPRIPVIKDLGEDRTDGTAFFSFSSTGTLLYRRGGEWSRKRQFVWIDRKGEVQPLTGLAPGSYSANALSPDGRRLAFTKFADGAENIWLYEVDGGRTTQITSKSDNFRPIWSPDGQWIAFASYRLGPFSVWRVPADLSGPEECLVAGAYDQTPGCWSPDGRWILHLRDDPKTRSDILRFSLGPDSVLAPLLTSPHGETNPRVSPGGRLIAYISDQSGRQEVYVRSYPAIGGILWNSDGGANWAFWAHDGQELYYTEGRKIMALPISSASPFKAGLPTVLFEGDYPEIGPAPDGRFLALQDEKEATGSELVVVVSWFEELKRLVPAGR